MSTTEIRAVGLDEAHKLAPLIAENAQALIRGAARQPDLYYAEKILRDKTAEVIGAFLGDRLVGFAVYFDLPEMVTGLRIGQLEDIYVHPDFRSQGIGRKMVEALVSDGHNRGWLHLRWVVPGKNIPAITLFDKIAEPDHRRNFIISIDRVAEDGVV